VVPGCLPFSSLIRCLSFRLPSPWFCWWCVGMGERTVVFPWWSCVGRMVAATLGCAYSPPAGLTGCCGAASSYSIRWLSCLWAAWLCVCHTALIWSTPWMECVGLASVQRGCSKVSKEQILHLIKNTQWWNWQDHLPKSESKTNSNPFSFVLLSLFNVYFADYKIKMKIMKTHVVSLSLDSFSVFHHVIIFLYQLIVKTLYYCIISIKYYLCLFYILLLVLVFQLN
jgi:hypothetical protein